MVVETIATSFTTPEITGEELNAKSDGLTDIVSV